MFAEPPPAAPPSLTAGQQSDLECLSIGFVLANSTHSGTPSPTALRLVRVYLGRLRSSDPSREWLKMTVPDSQMTYGWFLSRLRDCQRPFRNIGVRPAPTQAAPPQTPAATTGG
ncbi:MAG TPA: hypothetical protein VFE18_03445 [Phenylobacterium sp.]|jgi:hypothetical protein|uniref:hypothetical protein n=1 Tax=Phenylobacterium sp. TaxID=1871053 RepID=UPI002D5430CE|nr:hypothetical protein [Phenylobacterium sp.]HZZ67206.1 hypothetical protein [Phenylobacterium sp.]